ncbi:alpha/beta fold hydrolase [Kitasatospora sp. NPDC002227]|uniref:alpha/beta hydrolase family protein n=1 Tax=Kitasatospora sp. NPDC002227 TaxID=3154773 RepID=UPI00331AAAF4
MSTVARITAPALRRLSFTFATDGSHAACLAAGADGGWYVESWRLSADGSATPSAVELAGRRSESLRSQLVALPDGRVLVCRHDGERHDLVLLTAGGPGAGIERVLASLRMPGLRLLPVPGSTPGGPVAVALGTDTRPTTTVWLVYADGSAPRQIAELPGLHGGGVWLDRTGRLLALDQVADGVVKSVALDLDLGRTTPLLEIAERSNDRLVLFDPQTRFAMVRSDAPGEDRLGWGVLGGAEPLRFPEALHVPGVFLRPVALHIGSSDTPRVALQIDRGAASALAVWERGGGRLDPLPVPPGRLGAVGHWSDSGLRMPYSAPDHPAALATLDVNALLGPAGLPSTRYDRATPRGWRLDGSAAPADGSQWHRAESLELTGPAGPIEAVVYGGEAWLSARHLVIALHGGPADAWRLEFDPALQRMVSTGLAVLAPNQRGSTGYGAAHAMAIRGAWGGPDLADLLHLLESLAGQRAALGLEPPALFGVSYGAFLALLTAAHAPAGLVSRCAVVAPFLSGARLLAEASAPVRALTTRLGGAQPIEDELGPRDVLALAHRLTTPLLVVHGGRDEVVPVSQSRSLRHELLRQGRIEGTDFRYVEAAGAGHELLAEEGAAVLHELLAAFLATGRPT